MYLIHLYIPVLLPGFIQALKNYVYMAYRYKSGKVFYPVKLQKTLKLGNIFYLVDPYFCINLVKFFTLYLVTFFTSQIKLL